MAGQDQQIDAREGDAMADGGLNDNSPLPGGSKIIAETGGLRLTFIMLGLCLAVFLTGMASVFLQPAPHTK